MDWEGPYNHRPSHEVIVPEIQLTHPLNEQELQALPDAHVPLSQALPVYIETVQTLQVMLDSTLYVFFFLENGVQDA